MWRMSGQVLRNVARSELRGAVNPLERVRRAAAEPLDQLNAILQTNNAGYGQLTGATDSHCGCRSPPSPNSSARQQPRAKLNALLTVCVKPLSPLPPAQEVSQPQ